MDREVVIQARPTCDVCDKPVEQMVEVYDDFCRRLVLVARCHGESERVDIEEVILREPTNIQFGRAFVRPKLLEAKP